MSQTQAEMGTVVREGANYVEAWQRAKDRLARARDEVNRAECEVRNAEIALGRWLAPGDAKVGESFSVWYGDSLITGEVVQPATTPGAGGEFKVTIRKRDKSLR